MKRLLMFMLLIFTAGFSFANPSKISKDLRGKKSSDSLAVIVQYNQVPSEAHHQKVRNKGGQLKTELPVVKGGAYSLPASELENLAADPDITYITPDRQVRASLDFAEAATNANIALQYGWDGTGVGIAVIDSGISSHLDLKDSKGNLRIVYGRDLIGGGTDDRYGHGQHVAGILAGNGSRSSGSGYTHTFRGIAPNAKLINLRVLDSNGYGADSTVISGIQLAISLKTKYNIRIINLSLGRPVYESYALDPLCQAVESAWRAGIVVVVAAGNEGRNNSQGTDGYATINAPGNDPYVITVGAMKTMGTSSRGDDQIASYSSKGPTLMDHFVKPDLVAPGNRIISLLASNGSLVNSFIQNSIALSYYQATGSSALSTDYFRLSGTSMATPMVSGAAALLLQKQPSLTPDQLKARLMKTASKTFPATSTAVDPDTGVTYTSQYDIFTIGAGYLDIWAALNNTDLATKPAFSPSVRFDSSSGSVSVITDQSAVWGSTAVWGTGAVWGTNVFLNGTSAVWGTGAVWGSSTTQGFSAVWGTGAVWGTTSLNHPESLNVTIKGEN
jgi:serine protease AprX